eukprot:6210102-Pleurochrysis_carterae.AAC.3
MSSPLPRAQPHSCCRSLAHPVRFRLRVHEAMQVRKGLRTGCTRKDLKLRAKALLGRVGIGVGGLGDRDKLGDVLLVGVDAHVGGDVHRLAPHRLCVHALDVDQRARSRRCESAARADACAEEGGR